MKLKSLVAAGLAACAPLMVQADDLNLIVSTSALTHFNGTGDLFSLGSDDITFSGLAAGAYNISVTVSGQNVVFDAAQSFLGNPLGPSTGTANSFVNGFGTTISFYNIAFSGEQPFLLRLFGTDAVVNAGYSGDVTVTAVPEPETYALMLAGLGAMAFVARRRRPT